MATPPVLEPEEFLAPISDENPSGRSLAYELEYDELREARRAEDDTLQGDWQRQAKVADWERVLELGSELLKRETKDLQIAAWITEALVHRHGFAGLRDGLRLMRTLQDTFWETYYPQIDDGDLESRHGPFIFLNSVCPLLVRSIPLTQGFGLEQYSFLRWQESRDVANAGLKSEELMEKLIAEGKITSKQFDDEVAQTPRSFYETLVDDLRQALDALKELDQDNDRCFDRDAPSLVALRKAIEDCRRPLEPILAAKRAAEPDAEAEPELSAEESATTEEEMAEPEESVAPAPAAAPRRAAGAPRSLGGPITSAEDAQQRIVAAAAYLRQNEPGSPVPLLVLRALRMGEVYGMSRPPDTSQCASPASEVRQALKRLAADGEWTDLLEQAEQTIGRPEGRAWLDPQRYAVAAMAELYDADYSKASQAACSLLRAFLTDFPDLIDAELSDGTPTANAETRAWLRGEILPPAPEPEPAAEPEPEPEPEPVAYAPPPLDSGAPARPSQAEDEPPDPWDQALELVQARRTADAVQVIRRAMLAATTGRERFLRKLQLAELCLMANNHRVALPLSEELARQVDEFHLEQWEDEQLSARVWAALYRCLRAAGAENGNAERLQQVFTRLCRLDINQALAYGDDRASR